MRNVGIIQRYASSTVPSPDLLYIRASDVKFELLRRNWAHSSFFKISDGHIVESSVRRVVVPLTSFIPFKRLSRNNVYSSWAHTVSRSPLALTHKYPVGADVFELASLFRTFTLPSPVKSAVCPKYLASLGFNTVW